MATHASTPPWKIPDKGTWWATQSRTHLSQVEHTHLKSNLPLTCEAETAAELGWPRGARPGASGVQACCVLPSVPGRGRALERL